MRITSVSSRIARFEVCPVVAVSRCRCGAAISRSPSEPSTENPEVKDADAEPVLAGRVVLLEVAELGEGGHVAVRGAAGEGEPLRQFADAKRRAVRA